MPALGVLFWPCLIEPLYFTGWHNKLKRWPIQNFLVWNLRSRSQRLINVIFFSTNYIDNRKMTFHKIIAHYALVFRMFDMKLGVIWSEVKVTRGHKHEILISVWHRKKIGLNKKKFWNRKISGLCLSFRPCMDRFANYMANVLATSWQCVASKTQVHIIKFKSTLNFVDLIFTI